MKKWMAANAVGLVSIVIMGVGFAYGYGQLTQQVDDIKVIEMRLVERVTDQGNRLARIEGYLHHQVNGFGLVD